MNVTDAFKTAIESGEAKQAREAAELSQTDIAEMLGISPAAISRWESGSRVPREDLAAQYLAAVGIALQDDADCPPGQHKMPDGSCMENDVHPTGDRYGITGVATLEGTWTGDGRQFAKDGLSWPDPQETDIPFQWQKETSHGGDNDVTVNIGRLTSLERRDGQIVYDGFIDTGSDDGAEYVRRRQAAGSRGGVSIVADDPENGDIEVVFEGDEPVGVLFHSGRIRALTAVDVPAFAEAYVELTEPLTASAETEDLGPTGKSVSSASWSGSTSRFTDEQYRMSAAGCDSSLGSTPKEQCFLPHHEPGGAINRAGVHNAAARANQVQASAESKASAKAHLRSHYTRDLGEDPPESLSMTNEELTMVADTERDDGLDELRAIVAAASTITIEDAPPKEWFDEPQELPAAGAITVTDDGHFYGLLAPSHVAHRSFRNKRVEVPTGNVDYSRWMNRETITATGERIKTGAITMECGHASTSPLFRSNADNALQHYDNSCSVVATARIGENAHGVWISGALLPGVTRGQVARLMACQLSGDWQDHRESPGMREFVAALLVPVPGFPVGDTDPSLRMDHGLLVSSASPVQWVASGAIPDDETTSPEPETGENFDPFKEAREAAQSIARETTDEPDEEPEPIIADVVIDDLPSPEEAADTKKAEAQVRIKAMRAELGLDDEE